MSAPQLITSADIQARAAAGRAANIEARRDQPSAPKRPVRAKGAYRSALEAAYAEHLERLRLCGRILAWQYEPRRFVVGVRRSFLPDFRVVWPRIVEHEDRHDITYVECKGSVRAKNARDSLTRLATAAMLYPHLRFVLATRSRGDWHHTPIEAPHD